MPPDERELRLAVAPESLYAEPAARAAELAPALELLDVFRLYRSGPVETVALRGLDLRVERGAFVAVLGPSGSGKSTFLQLAAGLDEASAGEVRAFGRPLGRLDERELADYRARTVALVLQSGNLWPDLTARANLDTMLRLAGGRDLGGRVQRALSEFGLERHRDQLAGRLSGGEQQRLAIAGAAAREAPLVLADEPTGELDAANEEIVLQALRRLRDDHGATIVVVTHSRRVADEADSVVTIVDGRAA